MMTLPIPLFTIEKVFAIMAGRRTSCFEPKTQMTVPRRMGARRVGDSQVLDDETRLHLHFLPVGRSGGSPAPGMFQAVKAGKKDTRKPPLALLMYPTNAAKRALLFLGPPACN